MKRFFPIMNDDTEKGMHFALLAYWIFAFGVMPSWMPLFGDGFWDNLPVISWFEIAYHVINGVVIVIMLKTYLKDSFLNVQLDPKGFLKTVGFSVLLMLAVAAGLRYCLGRGMTDIYPIKEMSVALTSGLLVKQQPIFGTICLSLFTPFAVVGLFYVSIFAPVCRRNRWLGYVVVTVLMAVPCALDILWRGQASLIILIFILQLPMHWIACWTYQKADTVWAPILTLAIFNLGTSLMAFL
ncbi:MAG: hypothetical protein J6Q30_03665 [Oscillospiraceae bacterium]|nr:hypothetical protein [Oscillospiraceae bacterium]